MSSKRLLCTDTESERLVQEALENIMIGIDTFPCDFCVVIFFIFYVDFSAKFSHEFSFNF